MGVTKKAKFFTRILSWIYHRSFEGSKEFSDYQSEAGYLAQL